MSEAGETGGRIRLVEDEPDEAEAGGRLERIFGRDRAPRRPHDEERAAVSTEFALLLVLVALVIIAAVTAFGLSVSDLFDQGSAGIDGA